MKFKIYPRALFGYFGIITLFTFVHFYVDANLGTALLVGLCVLLILSVIMLVLNICCVRIEQNNKNIKLSKNKNLFYNFKIKSKLPIGCCFINVNMKKQEYLKLISEEKVFMMVDAFNPVEQKIEYKAKVYGTDFIGIENIIFMDFMGLISICKKVNDTDISVKTLPIYHDNSYDRKIFIFSSYVADFDDTEEVNATLQSSSGFPGYEHREYQEGDSLRRINYKISAKRDKFFIRLDEPVSSTRHMVILDNRTTGNRYLDEISVEGMISYVGCLVKNTITVEVCFETESGIQNMTISSEQAFEQFLDHMGEVKLVSILEKSRVFLGKNNKVSAVVVFSGIGKGIENLVQEIGVPYRIITPNPNVKGNEILHIDNLLNIEVGGGKYE